MDSLEKLLRDEFEIEDAATLKFIIMKHGERVFFESEESTDEHPMELLNQGGSIIIDQQDQMSPAFSRDVFTATKSPT